MDSNQPQPSQQVRLKESCDVCSASKIRCTKEKPTCKRCAKFSYTCSYSPARRIGRPHHTAGSRASSPPPPQPPPLSLPPAPVPASLSLPPSSAAATAAEQGRSVQLPVPLRAAASTGCPVTPTAARETPGLEGHSSAFTQQRRGPTDAGDSSRTSCIEQIHGILSSLSARPPSQDATSTALHIDTLSLDCVLTCACSESLDVALLVAAACHVILHLADCAPLPFFLPSATTAAAGLSSGLAGYREEGPGYGSAETAGGSEATFAGGLRKIANLIAHFSQRYGSGWDEGSVGETLRSVSGDLETRLQAIIQKREGWG